MTRLALCTSLMLLAVAAGPALADEKGGGRKFVVADHMGGEVAINTRAVTSVWRGPGAGDAARLRVNLDGGTQAFEGAAADAAWAGFHEGPIAKGFVFVPHLEGTLGIPVRSILTLYRSGSGADASVRIVYPGDPQGKTVTGAEAERVWGLLAD